MNELYNSKMSTAAIILSPKNLASLLKRGTSAKEIIKMIKKSPKEVMSRRDDTGQTLLHVAAVEGELELVQKLVDKFKASVEERDKNDWRPLHSATLGKNLHIMLFLLKAGALPSATNAENATPLHYFAKLPPPSSAAEEPLYQDVLTRLIQKGAHINTQNKSGQTALHKAVMERTERTLLINDLLAAKIDVHLTDANGETAAHVVSRNGNREVFEKLLRVGGLPLLTALSKQGETALSIARNSNQERLSHFISQYASVNGIAESKLLPGSDAIGPNGELGDGANGYPTSHSSSSNHNLNASGILGATSGPNANFPNASTANADGSSPSYPIPGGSISTIGATGTHLLADDAPAETGEVLARRNGIRRLNILQLIINGEQQLVHTLKWLNTSLADPIKEHCSTFSISLVDLNTIFNSELSALYKKHRSILETLRTRLKEFRGDHAALCVGDVFAELHAMRPHYKTFVAGAEESVLVCKRVLLSNPQFSAMVAKMSDSSRAAPVRASDLPGLLLSPIERVCGYHALLKDLQAVTPEGHSDKATLDLAIEYAAQISFDVLGIKKTAITKARILTIEESLDGFNEELYKPGREFVFEESILVKSLSIKGKQLPMRCSVYLFNDMLMWARKAGPMANVPLGTSGLVGNPGSNGPNNMMSSMMLSTTTLMTSSAASGGSSAGTSNSASSTTGTSNASTTSLISQGGAQGSIASGLMGGGAAGGASTAPAPPTSSGPAPMLGAIAAAALNQSFATTSLNVSASNPDLAKGPKNLIYCNSMSLKYVSTVTGTTDPDMKHAFEVSCEKENLRFVFGCDSDESRLAWISRICNQVSRVSLYQMWNTQSSIKGPSKRVSHTATVVGSRLYVFGGQYQNNYYNDMFIYHLENREWTRVPASPIGSSSSSSSSPSNSDANAPPSPRCEHCAVAVNSRIFYFGGFDGQKRLKDLYVFDTTTLKWMKPTIQSKRVPGGRSGHKMVYLNNHLWLFGGIDSHGTYLNDIYTLNLTKWQWSSVPIDGKMPAPRAFHSMDVLKTKIAVFGGYSFSRCHDDVAILDTRNRTWLIVSGEELRKSFLAANLSALGSGGMAAASKASTSGSVKVMTHTPMQPSNSGSSMNTTGTNTTTGTMAGNVAQFTSQGDSVAPYGRYHHASFVVDDYVIIQGGLAQGTASFCDLWALTTVDDQISWHPLPVALQLDHRFRHTISAFKNRTSGKVQAIMFGGISGLATSSIHQSDVIIFKDMELMVSSLMKSYRRTVRKVAAISRQDLLAETAGHRTESTSPRGNGTLSRRPGNGDFNSMDGEYDSANIEEWQRAIETLPPFSQAHFDPAVCRPETDFELLHALDTQNTMWVAKHVATNSVLLITTIKKYRAPHLGNNSAVNSDLISSSGTHTHTIPFIGTLTTHEDVWLLQEVSICSAAGIVRTLGVTLAESSLSIIARSALEGIQQLHKTYLAPTGICPEFMTISPQGQLKLAYHGIYDYIRDTPSTPNSAASSKHAKEKEKDGRIAYCGKLFDAPDIYCAPEVLDHRSHPSGKPINGEKADIYSLGLSLLYLWRGQVPTALVPSMASAASNQTTSAVSSLLPPIGSGRGQISSAFKEFLTHTLEMNPSKRPFAKTLLDHAFVSSAKASKPDSQLIEYANLWRLYRGKGKQEKDGSRLRDAYDPTGKFKATEAYTKMQAASRKIISIEDASEDGSGSSNNGTNVNSDLDELTDEMTDVRSSGQLTLRGVSFRDLSDDDNEYTGNEFGSKSKGSRASGGDISFRKPQTKPEGGNSDPGSRSPLVSPKSSSGSITRTRHGSKRGERRLHRQNTYEANSGVVVSRAYADDDEGARDDGDGDMSMYNENDDSGDEGRYGYDDNSDDDGATASLSQLKLLQEEYMEVQQSTAETHSKMANELAELRMKLSIAQNELASTQAEFERRVEERVEREVAELKAHMSREIEAKVAEQRDQSEQRFTRQLELAKYQLADEFKLLQRDIYRFIGSQQTSSASGAQTASTAEGGSQQGQNSGVATSPSPTSTPQGPNRRSVGAPLWKRPSGRHMMATRFGWNAAEAAGASAVAAAAQNEPLHSQMSASAADVNLYNRTSSASSITSHPKSLSDPGVSQFDKDRSSPSPSLPPLAEVATPPVTHRTKASTDSSLATLQETDVEDSPAVSRTAKPSTPAAPSSSGTNAKGSNTANNSTTTQSSATAPSSSKMTASSNPTSAATPPQASATTSTLSSSSKKAGVTPSVSSSPLSISKKDSSPSPAAATSAKSGSPQLSKSTDATSSGTDSSSSGSSSGSASGSSSSSASSASSSEDSPGQSGSMCRSESSEGMSEAAREATMASNVDVSKIWHDHSKNPSLPQGRK